MARDEARNKIVAHLVGRTLDEFELEPCDFHVRNDEVALGIRQVGLPPPRGGGEVPREEAARLVDLLDCQRDMVEVRKPIRLRAWMRRIEVGYLPKLNESSEGRPR